MAIEYTKLDRVRRVTGDVRHVHEIVAGRVRRTDVWTGETWLLPSEPCPETCPDCRAFDLYTKYPDGAPSCDELRALYVAQWGDDSVEGGPISDDDLLGLWSQENPPVLTRRGECGHMGAYRDAKEILARG